jgi:hypothetical protein
MKKVLVIIGILSLILGWSNVSFALVASDVPEGVQTGPNPDEIPSGPPAGVETGPGEIPSGGPTEVPSGIPNEIPGIPSDARLFIPDKDLVEVYCLMTKWKSGDLLAALDSLEENLLPAMSQSNDLLGLDLTLPDVLSLKSKAQQKIDAICNAATIEAANNALADLSSYGQEVSQQSKDLNKTMTDKMQVKSDALKNKLQTKLQPTIDAEKEKMQTEINDYADTLKNQAEVDLTAEISGMKFDSEAAAMSYVNSKIETIKASITNEINTKVNVKKAELQKTIESKVEEIIGPERSKFQEVGKIFSDMGNKIQAGITAGKAQYEKYKTEAFAKRKSIILELVDKNIEKAKVELEKNRAQLEEGKKSNPAVKNVDEVLAEMQSDRDVLNAKLDQAIASDNEAAIQAATDEFRNKWENYRAETEKLFLNPETICKRVTIELAANRPQLDAGKKQLQDIISKCSGKTDEQCLKVNELSPRFGTIMSKLDSLALEMKTIENLCVKSIAENKLDPEIMSLLDKIKADGEDAKIYGEALQAEKSKIIAESATQACAQLLPQLSAAKTEISKNDLATLKNNISSCSGKNTEQCKVVNGLKTQVIDFETQVASFVKNADAAIKICQTGQKTEDDLFNLQAFGNGLKAQSETLKAAGQKLRAEQEEKGSEKAFCRAAVAGLAIAKTKIYSGLKEMNTMQSDCKGKTDSRCQGINSFSARFFAIKSKSDQALKQITSIETVCENAGTKTPDPALIQQIDDLSKAQAEIEKMVADLKADADALRGGKDSIWIEAEGAVTFNKRLGVSNPMAREINPSWRPPYFGDGSWYMGAGGDYLAYKITAKNNGNYNVWVRDLASNIPSQLGQGVITIYFDSKSIGSFAENTQGRNTPYPKGAFFWHKVAVVALTAGDHIMKIEKQSTTSRAADLDAFYLTTGNDVPPEK